MPEYGQNYASNTLNCNNFLNNRDILDLKKMKLWTRRIQKLIEAHPGIRTHAVHIYWDIYGMYFNIVSEMT